MWSRWVELCIQPHPLFHSNLFKQVTTSPRRVVPSACRVILVQLASESVQCVYMCCNTMPAYCDTHFSILLLHFTSVLQHLNSVLLHFTSVLRHLNFVLIHSTGVLQHLNSVLLHFTSVLQHLNSVLLHITSVLRHLNSVLLHSSGVLQHHLAIEIGI